MLAEPTPEDVRAAFERLGEIVVSLPVTYDDDGLEQDQPHAAGRWEMARASGHSAAQGRGV